MEREKAIEHLEKKKKIEDPYIKEERKFSKNEEKKIQKVMKEGKIYGDPSAEIEF